MKTKIVSLERTISKVKKLAENKLAEGISADEFLEIGNADNFKIYVAVGKTIGNPASHSFHENPRDVFMLVLEGEIEFIFRNGERTTVKRGQCFVLPKHMKHQCVFRELTVCVEGVYEKGL
jgi:quercetin dioxygenase-like cupin family protein